MSTDLLVDAMKPSLDERIQRVEAIWDTVHPSQTDLPATEAQKALLDERLTNLEANPDAGSPWEECAPPVLKGEYEHYDLLGLKPGLGGSLELQLQTIYPGADVAQFCTGKRVAVPQSRNPRPEALIVLSPVFFGMTPHDSADLRISADKKSLIHKKAGWT